MFSEILVLLGTHFSCKYPVEEKEHFVAWHQDMTYWGLEPPLAHTTWIAINDSGIENVCLKVITSSHRKGQQIHETSEMEGNLISINQEIPGKFIYETQAVILLPQSRPNYDSRGPASPYQQSQPFKM